MTNVHEAVWRDGEALTLQHWQRFDRMNAHPEINGMLVVIQGGFSSAPDSGTTHRLLGVADYRRWNLNDDQAFWVTRVGRDLMGTCNERTTWQGFDPHFHDCTLGDDIPGVMDAVAIQQVETYKAGGDGVAGTSGDWQPYRPNPIHDYIYLEDDMNQAEHDELFRIGNRLDAAITAEVARDKAEAERDKRRFTEVITMLGKEVDFNRRILPKISDAATKKQVQTRINEVMTYLKENPDVTGVDNPADSQMP